jgi:hypothetical protein
MDWEKILFLKFYFTHYHDNYNNDAIYIDQLNLFVYATTNPTRLLTNQREIEDLLVFTLTIGQTAVKHILFFNNNNKSAEEKKKQRKRSNVYATTLLVWNTTHNSKEKYTSLQAQQTKSQHLLTKQR